MQSNPSVFYYDADHTRRRCFKFSSQKWSASSLQPETKCPSALLMADNKPPAHLQSNAVTLFLRHVSYRPFCNRTHKMNSVEHKGIQLTLIYVVFHHILAGAVVSFCLFINSLLFAPSRGCVQFYCLLWFLPNVLDGKTPLLYLRKLSVTLILQRQWVDSWNTSNKYWRDEGR